MLFKCLLLLFLFLLRRHGVIYPAAQKVSVRAEVLYRGPGGTVVGTRSPFLKAFLGTPVGRHSAGLCSVAEMAQSARKKHLLRYFHFPQF